MQTLVREAKIFEANKYPERGIEFNESDLDALVAGFKSDISSGVVIPIKVQHGRSPWEGKFGRLVEVWRSGRDLLAKIEWPKAVWDFLESMGTKSLSVGFDWRQRRIREVSVVDLPRVLTARAFGDTIPESGLMEFSFDFVAESEGGYDMAEQDLAALIASAEERGRNKGLAEGESQFKEREKGYTAALADLARDSAKREASLKLAVWKGEGKLPPAIEKYAEAILIDGRSEVTFADGGHMSCADALVQLMTNLPRLVEIPGEKVPNSGVSPEDKKVYSLLGLTVEEIEAAEKAGEI